MTRFLKIAALAAGLSLPLVAHAQTQAVTQDEYMAYIAAAAEEGWEDLEASRTRWRESIDLNYVFGYNPPPNDLYLAALNANLFEITQEGKYLDRAKELLLYYGKYRDAYPADYYQSKAEYSGGLPVMPNIFSFGKYVHAYDALKRHGRLSADEDGILVEAMAGSADYLVQFQEWGPMNRAMLRAEAITYVAKVLED
ncbi:MAG TPA: hypothetical protein VGA18_03420, partial [Rhodothermales bacterium]